jgi:hypothetical protein
MEVVRLEVSGASPPSRSGPEGVTISWRAAAAMVAARHRLAEDVDAVGERAGALWDFLSSR